MRGELLYKILNFVEDTFVDLVDFQIAILESGYNVSTSKIEYNYEKKRRRREDYQQQRNANQQSKLRLQKYLSKLEKDGLIVRKGIKIAITPDGKKKLIILRGEILKNTGNIRKETGPNLIIVSYDFPVAERRLRDRTREIFKILDFKMIHQSLWVGKVKIPQEFIKYLEGIGALKYIEILEVTKRGTIKPN